VASSVWLENNKTNDMKIYHLVLAGLIAFATAVAQSPQPPAVAPPPIPAPSTDFTSRLSHLINRASGAPEPALTKFSLDFGGGTPKQLVTAIEKSLDRPLNAIISDEHAAVKLPPLKMKDVTVPQLFAALTKISYKYDNNRNVIGSYGFETEGGQPTEDSIWRFFSYNAGPSAPSALTRFSLDFPGGTPKQLAVAIEKATDKPLNVVIPVEHSEMKLPPLRMNNVDVSQLFQALESASLKSEAYVTGTYSSGQGTPSQSYQIARIAYGFKTQGRATDESIWYFFVDKPAGPPLSPSKACRFYSLTPYLERGTSVDDITTAIQTGWKMLGEKETPTINFHKDTKLLIAVGEPNKLETIDSVLKALQPTPEKVSSLAPLPASPPKVEKKPKTETEN
jgi:hypothetical protein